MARKKSQVDRSDAGRAACRFQRRQAARAGSSPSRAAAFIRFRSEGWLACNQTVMGDGARAAERIAAPPASVSERCDKTAICPKTTLMTPGGHVTRGMISREACHKGGIRFHQACGERLMAVLPYCHRHSASPLR